MLPTTPPHKYSDKIPIVTAAEAEAPVEAAAAAAVWRHRRRPRAAAESPRAAAAVPRIKYLLFELVCPQAAAAVLQQHSSQPAGPGCWTVLH